MPLATEWMMWSLLVGIVGMKLLGCEVNKCTEAGGIFKFYVADWFALMNDKMGGDMKKIKVCIHLSIKLSDFSSCHFGHIFMRPVVSCVF